MSLPLSPDHLALATAHPLRVVVPALLSDPAGPLGEYAAHHEDAPAAYLLGVLYRRSRYEGILHGKPPFEAEPLFANRIRTTARRALDPFAWMVDLSRKLGVRWEALPEEERLWWRARAHDLAASPDGVSLRTDWTKLRQDARLADLITSAMIAQDWIGQLKDAQKEHTP
jgi:hypothetical protein